MAEITASMVKDLRERTGLGMMECKSALAETQGDMKAAEDLLRIKSGAKATKASQRIAAEGVVASYIDTSNKSGALVEVNCETDFVAKNQDFMSFANELAQLVTANQPENVAKLHDMTLANGETVEKRRQNLIMKIGENMTIRRFSRVAATGRLARYVHGGGKLGVIVDYSGGDEQLGKDLGMHIAFHKPMALSKEQVPADVLTHEREIAQARAAESGKPPNIVEKIVEGNVAKFLSEATLLGQPFVKDDKISIEKLLASKQATVNAYQFFVVGEGIEKKQSDFAAEVAAMARPTQN